MSTLTYFFLKHGGHIKCEITGVKKYSKDFEKGGLRFPLDWKSAMQIKEWQMP